MLKVLIGSKEQAFYVHRGILEERSGFFRNLLRNEGFKESKDGVVRLPEDDVVVFACFFEWLYHRAGSKSQDILNDVLENLDDTDKGQRNSLASSSDRGLLDTSAEHRTVAYDFYPRFSCYFFGDKLQAPEFQKYIMEDLKHMPEDCGRLNVEHVFVVYEKTARDDDHLRKWCIDILGDTRHNTLHDVSNNATILQLCQHGGDNARDLVQLFQLLAWSEKQKKEWREEVIAKEIHDVINSQREYAYR